MCHTGPYTVPTAQLSLCHHPFPGHGRCQGRGGFWGAGLEALCAHPPVLQSANPPHTHLVSCPGGHPPVPTPHPTPPRVLSLPGYEPRGRGTGREGSPPHHSALPAPGLASPSQPCYSALWTQDLLSRRKWKWVRAQLCHDPRSGAQDLLQYHPGAAPGGQTLVRGYGVTTSGVPARGVVGTGTHAGHPGSSTTVTCDYCDPGSAQIHLSPSRGRVHPRVSVPHLAAATSGVLWP